MQDLKVSIVQTKLIWEDIPANLAKFTDILGGFGPGSTDVVVLPEMFSTGFSMQPEALAETMEGSAVQWMAAQAQRLQAVVTGSLIIQENNQYYNRLLWMQPDGNYQTYDKRHLFSLGDEQNHYTAGTKRLIVQWKGWKICPLVCYDLRFPVWCRNRGNDYDLLVFVANWPDRRSHAWRQLMVARAIENQAYVVGVNRTGHDGNGVYHAGYSGVVEPLGENADTRAHEDFIHTFVLSGSRLLDIRGKLPFLQDADDFEIK